MYRFALTTISWLESIAKKEIEKCSWAIEKVDDKIIVFSWNENTMISLNLSSRVWNKVYILFWEEENTINFDKLYDFTFSLDWSKIVNKNYKIIVKSKSISSTIFATNSVQKIWKKAIIDKLVWKNKLLEEDELSWIIEILFLLKKDNLKILINTSWEALHKRWYRLSSWDAPIKESLAAWLVILSNWSFKNPFYDLFCWSWTIAIEAAMLAKNIAPWIHRKFAFEDWSDDYRKIKSKLIEEFSKKEYSWDYKIYASDLDEDVLEFSKQNAKKAWVYDIIKFEKKDFRKYLDKDISGTLVSNPPYGLRLKDSDLNKLYKDINYLFFKNKDLHWWIISSYEWNDNIMTDKSYKKRKLYNGWELCYFYKKKK